jgi:hypothetical protein
MKKKVQPGQHASHSMIDKILFRVRRVNIYILVIGPIVISLLVLGILLFAGNQLYGEKEPEVYQAATGVIFLVLLSFSGVTQVYRREGPGPLGYPVFGVWPIISGCIIIIICWASITYLLIRIYNLVVT